MDYPLLVVVLHYTKPLRKPGLACQALSARYLVIAPDGKRVLCWDSAKYVNHSCHFNALSTGYGFEVAVHNIQPGQEVTNDYGVFNLGYELELNCRYADCRQWVRHSDFETYGDTGDGLIRQALEEFLKVPQPLLRYLDAQSYAELMSYLGSGEG